ncbi:MAG: TonB-dependent receptor, partial [Pseudomonadota bacterium]
RSLFIASTVLASTSLPAIASAQGEVNALEEIFITAQKREQSLKDVPVTVSVFTGDLLNRLNATEFDEISLFIPGLTVQEQSPNNPGFVIRGITSDSGSAQIAPRVSIYYNGVDVSRSRGSYFDLMDVERIEVVKGPQSTLFGTAAAIGAISVITNKPEPGFSGEASFSYGSLDLIESQGFINAGNDIIAGRFAYSVKKRDGFITNDFPGPGSLDASEFGEALNGQDVLAFRASLRFTPNEDLTVDLIGSFDQQNPPGTAFVSGTLPGLDGDTNIFNGATLSGSPQSEEILGGEELGLERDVFDINLTIAYDVNERWKVTSITNYREFDSVEVFDADGSGAPYLEFTEDAVGDQWSQELRVNYQGEGFSAFMGGSYFHEDGTQRIPFATEEGVLLECLTGALGLGCVAPDGTAPSTLATSILTGGALSEIPYSQVLGNTGSFDIWSIYGDATVNITDRLEISVGLRYVNESRISGAFNDAPASQLAPLLINSGSEALAGLGFILDGFLPLGGANTDGEVLDVSRDYSDWLMRANVLYRLTEDISVYATAGRGRRSDVITLEILDTRDVNGTVVDVPPYVEPTFVPAEIIWNYEAGLKGNFFDNRLFATIGIFYQDYENFQVTVAETDSDGQPTGQFITQGAGSATNWGIEVDFSAQVMEDINLFGNAAYIDAEIDDDPENGNLAGQRFRLQPRWAAAIGALYERDLTDEVAVIGSLTWTFEGQKFFEQPNVAGIEEDSYSLVNARFGFKDPDDIWQVEAFVNNMLDKEYRIDGGNTGGAFGIPTFIPGAPRIYGVEVTGRF